jgi:predicted phosphodiesterase
LELGETMMLGLRLAEGVSNQRFRRQLERLYPRADLIAFGHTHRAYVGSIGDTLLVNPGAVAPTLGEEPSAARIWLGHGEPEVEIVPLQSYASG